MAESTIDPADVQIISDQLGRPVRDIVAVASRCPSGHPNVVTTRPRLSDGTPFPTVYYLTCPRLSGAIGTLEAAGLMTTMTERLAEDADLAEHYRRAHEAYLADRAALGHVAEVEGISAGGMPNRVKCLHVLAAHSLAVGRGINPLGDETLDLLGDWGCS